MSEKDKAGVAVDNTTGRAEEAIKQLRENLSLGDRLDWGNDIIALIYELVKEKEASE